MAFGVILPEGWGSRVVIHSSHCLRVTFLHFCHLVWEQTSLLKLQRNPQAKTYGHRKLKVSWRIAKWSGPMDMDRVHKPKFPFLKPCKSFLLYLGKKSQLSWSHGWLAFSSVSQDHPQPFPKITCPSIFPFDYHWEFAIFLPELELCINDLVGRCLCDFEDWTRDIAGKW